MSHKSNFLALDIHLNPFHMPCAANTGLGKPAPSGPGTQAWVSGMATMEKAPSGAEPSEKFKIQNSKIKTQA